MSFIGMEATLRLKQSNPTLNKLSQIIDWKSITRYLEAFQEKPRGQKPYDLLGMFKAILLQQWYSLSDPELEQALNVRMDFIAFTGLEQTPDETTLCRFRNKLVRKGLVKELLKNINKQLEDLGLKIKACEGAVLDATIIESQARPKKSVNIIAQDRNENNIYEEEEKEGCVSLSYSADEDARWLKKGRRYHFGYKAFVTSNVKEGYIEKVHLTPANQSEMKELEKCIPQEVPKRLYADKGYASQGNREILKSQGIKDGIMNKAHRNRPLTYWEKLRNKLISARRFIIEQDFGTLKRRFRFKRASYMGLEKVDFQLTMKSLCFNLLKAMNKVVLS